jgi:hypothetical protein
MSADAAEHTVVARADRRCDGYRCHRKIKSREEYVRMVAFPNHDANGGTTPWVLRICIDCWREHDVDRPMPPRMVSKR